MEKIPKLRYKGFSDSWSSESLNTNAKIITGKTPRTSDLSLWQNDVDFVTPTDIVGKYQKKVDRKVTDTTAIQSIILEPGAIAYTCIASIGKMSIITKKSITNQQINSIIVSNNDTEYIYYNLLRNEGRIRSMAGDFGMAMINKTDFSNISITLPSYMEQKKISSMLAKIDILINEKEKEIICLEKFQSSTISKLLSSHGEFSFDIENQNSICTKKFGDTLETIIGGGTPSRTVTQFWDGQIPWCTVKDFKDTKHIANTQEYISELGLNNSSTKLIAKGNLIIPTRMSLGKIAINGIDMAINQDLKACIPKKEFDTNFLYYSYLFQQEHIKKLGSGSTVAGISLDDLKGLNIRIFNLETQQTIGKLLSKIDHLITEKERNLSNYMNMKTYILKEMLI